MSLDLAADKGGSIAFSCLSTGVYGYPPKEAAEVASREVRRWLEEEDSKGERKGRLERVVFCCFEAKDERAYGEWLPYACLSTWAMKTVTRLEGPANVFSRHRKIFPPTSEELPSQGQSTEAEEYKSTEDTAVSAPANETDEAAAKTLKTDSEDLDKGWEAVEKPNEAVSEKGTEISEEGEKVEAPDLSKDDGEKIEKPLEKEPLDAAATSGEALPKINLLKDW